MQAILEDLRAKGGELAHAAAYDDNAAASALLSKAGFTHSEWFYFEPYSDREPWGYDTVYAEIDLTKPHNGHRKAIGDTGIIQGRMIRMYRRFDFHVPGKLLNWTRVM